MLVVFCYAVGQSIMVPAVGDLAIRFGATTDAVSWTMSGNLVATALATALFGRLGDLYGRRRMLFVSIGLALAGSAIGLLPSLSFVITGRVVQGLGGGIFALSFGIFRANASGRRRASGIGLLGAATGFGGIAGIPVGSLVTDIGGYQWMFGLGILTATASLLLVWLAVPSAGGRLAAVSVNWTGSAGLAVAVTLLLLAVSRMHDWGPADGRTAGLLVAGIAGVAVLVRREGRIAHPLIDVRILRHREVALAGGAAFIVGAVFYAIMFLVSQLARVPSAFGGLGLDGAQTSLLLLPGCALMTATGFVAGRVIRVVGSRHSLSLGAGLALAGLVLLAVVATAPLVAASTAIVCAGVGLAIAALPNIIVESVPADRTSETTGVNSLFRIFGSAVGAQVSVALLVAHAARHGGYTSSFVVMALAMSLVLVGVWVVPRSGPGPVEGRS